MTFDCDAWLNEPLKDSGKIRHERLCYLVVANGGFLVRGWGFLSFGGGHDSGLEQEDAIELIQWASFMDGLAAAGVPIFDRFKPILEAYVKRFADAEKAAAETPA